MTSSVKKETDRETLSFASCVNNHKGERFLVCGTGPSIDQYPKSFYENFDGVTIGVNDILDLFTPDYHINIHERPNVIRCKNPDIDLIFTYRNPSTGIDIEKTGKLSMVGTVALTALTAAYQMGASEISLIGVDLIATEDKHHFTGCSSLFLIGGTHVIEAEDELKATVRGFDRAFDAYQEYGVKMINLSKHSILEVQREAAVPC